jgi:hypothetical protein
MPKKYVDYSNTIIYKIYCKDECITDIYVGHTTNYIQRKSSHKVACNNEKNDFKIYKIIRENGGWDNWNMIEIAKYNCKDSTEARIKENEHYNQLKATLNSCPPYVDKNNYFCSTCNLQCSSPNQYEIHLKSVTHNNLNLSKKENINNHFTSKHINKFMCESCNYKTWKKSSYDTHIISARHKRITQNDDEDNYSAKILPKFDNNCHLFVCSCGKEYQYRQGLWKHKQTCNKNDLETYNKNNDNIILLNDTKNEPINKDQLIMMLIKENSDFKSMLIEQQSMMMKLIENGTTNNSNNITF